MTQARSKTGRKGTKSRKLHRNEVEYPDEVTGDDEQNKSIKQRRTSGLKNVTRARSRTGRNRENGNEMKLAEYADEVTRDDEQIKMLNIESRSYVKMM